jgi:hypothetical protein
VNSLNNRFFNLAIMWTGDRFAHEVSQTRFH